MSKVFIIQYKKLLIYYYWFIEKIRSEAIYKSKQNETTGTGLKILYRNLSQYLKNPCVSVFIMQSNLKFCTDISIKDTYQIPENQISVTESLRNNISNYATVLTKKTPYCMSCLFCLTKKRWHTNVAILRIQLTYKLLASQNLNWW